MQRPPAEADQPEEAVDGEAVDAPLVPAGADFTIHRHVTRDARLDVIEIRSGEARESLAIRRPREGR